VDAKMVETVNNLTIHPGEPFGANLCLFSSFLSAYERKQATQVEVSALLEDVQNRQRLIQRTDKMSAEVKKNFLHDERRPILANEMGSYSEIYVLSTLYNVAIAVYNTSPRYPTLFNCQPNVYWWRDRTTFLPKAPDGLVTLINYGNFHFKPLY
jgi:hypothetical protein